MKEANPTGWPGLSLRSPGAASDSPGLRRLSPGAASDSPALLGRRETAVGLIEHVELAEPEKEPQAVERGRDVRHRQFVVALVVHHHVTDKGAFAASALSPKHPRPNEGNLHRGRRPAEFA